jgi:predicted lipoprotein with Yx(FWY)xxD motif
MISIISRRAGLAMLVFVGLAVLVACGSSKTGSSTGTSSAGPVTVETRTGPMGTYLTDGQGRSLYLFVADTSGTSTCNGACAGEWPPVLTSDTPQAGKGATASMLGTVDRSDGTKQVTYNNHPLYLFHRDSAAGEVQGQGVNEFGALWWLVTPAGDAITTTSSPSPGGSTTSPHPSVSAS